MEDLYIDEVTKRRISEAFIRLIEKKDFKSVSITEIVDEAGVSRSTFYRNFDSKEAVIRFHFDHLVKKFKITENFDVETEEGFEKALCYMLSVVKINKRVIGTFMELDGGTFILRYLDAQYAGAYADKHNDESLVRYLYSGAMYNVLKKWIEGGCNIPSEEVAKVIRMIPRE